MTRYREPVSPENVIIRDMLELEGNDRIIINIENRWGDLIFSMEGSILEDDGCMSDFDQNHQEIYDKYIVGKPEYAKKAQLKRLIEIWKKYKWNDLRAGTEKQMDALDGRMIGYDGALEYLDSIGLKFDGDYEYGSDWFFLKVPDEIIKELNEIIKAWDD